MKHTRKGGHRTGFKTGETKAVGVAAPTQVCSPTCSNGRFLDTELKSRAGSLKPVL